MLDSVLQEEHLHQASAHLRGRCFQSLVHFQLPVRRQLPPRHRCQRGEEGLQCPSMMSFYMPVKPNS